MTWQQTNDPVCRAREGEVALLIESRARDLGGFDVRRVLPAEAKRSVGPFVFFDHMGPVDFPPGKGIDVRPHPHIGLATVTYLFTGEILHRDSLGFVQPIHPGAVNLMTAGRGIVHSERTSVEALTRGRRLDGIQTWMALPDGHEEIDPAFVHYPANVLPVHEEHGLSVTVIAGEAFGLVSPVQMLLSTLYLDVRADAGAVMRVPDGVAERAIYVASGAVHIESSVVGAGTMAVLGNAGKPEVCADAAARFLVVGGASAGPRHVWWNFVASSPERIGAAKRRWAEGGFPRVPGDDEFIPLPDR